MRRHRPRALLACCSVSWACLSLQLRVRLPVLAMMLQVAAMRSALSSAPTALLSSAAALRSCMRRQAAITTALSSPKSL